MVRNLFSLGGGSVTFLGSLEFQSIIGNLGNISKILSLTNKN